MSAEQPKLSLGERAVRLSEASREFGGANKVPEDILSQLGYVRQIQGETVSLIPAERVAKMQEETVFEQRNTPWSPEKEGLLPFHSIEVPLSQAEVTYRYIPESQLPILYKKVREIRNYLIGAMHPSELTDNLGIFWDNFNEFLTEYQEEDLRGNDALKEKTIVAEELSSALSSIYYEDSQDQGNTETSFLIHSPNAFIDSYITSNIQNESFISTKEAQNLHEFFDKTRGKIADLSEYKKVFSDAMEHAAYTEELYNDSWEFQQYLQDQEIETRQEVTIHFLQKYLQNLGVNSVASGIRKEMSFDDVGELISKHSFSEKLIREEKLLKNRIKNASIEEKKAVSGRLKEIHAEKKWREQIRQGILDVCYYPERLAEIINRKLDDVQKFLRISTAEYSEEMFTLTAVWDPEKDVDPGRISRDCTEGLPLPISDPDVPVYNVKVYGKGKNHLGNIYLLSQRLKEDSSEMNTYYDELTEGVIFPNPELELDPLAEKHIWHLDAIQVPVSTIDWDHAVMSLITGLASEAEKKGVGAITVNQEPHHISNYDFISDALVKYIKNSKAPKSTIYKPSAPNERYSEFQGEEDVYVVWQHKENSENDRRDRS